MAQLPNDFSKAMFKRFWTGEGDYKLSEEEFMHIFWVASQNGINNKTGTVVYNNYGVEITRKSISFRGTEYETVFGSHAELYYLNDKPYGFQDTYDFNKLPWGRRSYMNEIKTRAVNDAAIMYGENSSNFIIYFYNGNFEF